MPVRMASRRYLTSEGRSACAVRPSPGSKRANRRLPLMPTRMWRLSCVAKSIPLFRCNFTTNKLNPPQQLPNTYSSMRAIPLMYCRLGEAVANLQSRATTSPGQTKANLAYISHAAIVLALSARNIKTINKKTEETMNQKNKSRTHVFSPHTDSASTAAKAPRRMRLRTRHVAVKHRPHVKPAATKAGSSA